MFSYWERQSFVNYDHIIIGSGIVGLSTAVELKQRFPTASVLVVERGILPTGASTKNAGFACMGSVTELLDDLETMSEEEVVQLFERRKKGLELLRERLGDGAIGYKTNGSHELISETEINAIEKIEYLNQLLLPVNKKDSFRLCNEYINSYGFNKTHIKALIENTCEGELHTGKMMHALMSYATQLGVEIKTGVTVKEFNEEADKVVVQLKNSLVDEVLPFTCKQLFVCTNAFTKQLLPNEEIMQGRGQVLVTEPIEGLKLKGVFHMDKGYYYFREIEGRVMIGGGRNEAIQKETTSKLGITDTIQNKLEEKLRDIILPGIDYTVAQRWAGIMAFGADKQPLVKQVSDRVYGAFRLGGMGVAMGSYVAKELVTPIPR